MGLGEDTAQFAKLGSVRRGLTSTSSMVRVRGEVEEGRMDANSTSNQDHRSVGNDIDVFHSSVFFLFAVNGNTNGLQYSIVGCPTPKQVP